MTELWPNKRKVIEQGQPDKVKVFAMKVTILQKHSTSLLTRSHDSQKPITKMHTPHKVGKSWKQKLGFYLMGFIIGFLLSQCIMNRYKLQFGQDYIQIRMEADVVKKPFDIYIEGSKVQTTGAGKSKYLPWSKLESSIFISAILNAIQQNIREEIENEGFIIADLDKREVPASENKVSDQRPDLEHGLSLSQSGHGYFRKWDTRSPDLTHSGYEWKLLKWFSQLLGSRNLGQRPQNDVHPREDVIKDQTSIIDYAETAEAPGLG